MKNKKILLLALILTVTFVSVIFYNTNITHAYMFDMGYKIGLYEVDININENNVYDIRETIQVNFLEQRHGIYRILPINNFVERENSRSRVKAIISDFTVQKTYYNALTHEYVTEYEPFQSNRNGDNMIYKIGSENIELTGNFIYTISYSYNYGLDACKDIDEFYFNLIGTEWTSQIATVKFNVQFPKPFDYIVGETVGVTYGLRGSESSLTYGTHYFIDDATNTIHGEISNSLLPYNGITLRVELPEGYFVGASNNIDYTFSYIGMALSILFVIIAFLLWAFYGKDRIPTRTVEFYPPDDLNSCEIGLYYKGRANSKDIASLMIYLASKGYIKIEEKNEEFQPLGKTTFITKLKEYDGKNKVIKLYMEIVFGNLNTASLDTVKQSIAIRQRELYKLINAKEEINKVIDSKSNILSAITLLMSMLAITLSTFSIIIDFLGEVLVFMLVFPITILFLVWNLYKTEARLKILNTIILMVILFVSIVMLSLFVIMFDLNYLPALIIGISSTMVILVLSILMPKRTEFGTQILGKILGFRDYIKTVELNRIKTIMQDDPEYFYDILPYAYVLGVSDKWIKKFEAIDMTQPSWYSSTTPFSFYYFTRVVYSDVNRSSGVGVPHGSGFGGMGTGGGGGFSGGGGGGGGGGSW